MKATAQDSDVTIGTYSYDGQGRRIKKVVTNSGNLDGTELYFYGQGHQVIEVRDGSENMVRQVVHGLRYIDEAVLEILEDGVVWVHQDANWNVLALTDFAGRTLEHYDQTPYGIITVDQESYWGDSDADGKVTEAEWDTDTDGSLDSDDDCWGSDPSGTCRLVDFDFDGDVDASDSTRLAQLDSSTTYRTPGQTRSQLGNTRAHQGLIYDAEIASFNNRRRQYAPNLKRFVQRDPLEYRDGANGYGYTRFNPLVHRDPAGLEALSCDTTCTEDPASNHGYAAQARCCFEDAGSVPGKRCSQIICWGDGAPPPPNCENTCVAEHEDEHLDQYTCGEPWCGACELRWMPLYTTWNAAECPAYTRELECLKNCSGSPDHTCRWVACMMSAACDPGDEYYNSPEDVIFDHCDNQADDGGETCDQV